MRTIYKYEIPLQDYFTLELPKNAEILTVQAQLTEVKELYEKAERPFIWAIVEVDSNETMILQKRFFRLSGTGHNLDKDFYRIKKYIGTFRIVQHGLVFHLFEIYKEKEITLSKKGIKKVKEALKDIKEGRVVKV